MMVVEHWFRIGDMLERVKTQVKHKGFLPLFELSNAGVLGSQNPGISFGIDQARLYMKAAKSKNLKRRHLKADQRAAIAVEMLQHFEAQAKKRQQAAGETHGRGQEKVTAKMPEPIEKGKARQQAAKQFEVGERYNPPPQF